MKKIILSAYACSPNKGSEEGRGWNWAVGLAERGYDVICLTNFVTKKEILFEHEKLNLPNLKFVFVELKYNLDERLFNPSAKSIYFHYFLWKQKATSIAVKLHKELNFDIAHHVTYGSLQQGSCLYKLKNCKIIFGPVGGGQMALPIFKPYFGKHWKIEIIRGFISKVLVRFSSSLVKTVKKATYIIATNPETKELLIKTKYGNPKRYHLSEIYAIPKQYNSLKYIEKKFETELKILWIGRILPRKGLNLTIHALSMVAKNIPFKLTIVGGGVDKSIVQGWMHEYGLDANKVDFLGQIPFEEVAYAYQKADVMLFCSLRDTSGTQIMEAMAYSLPLITLNISGVRNLVPENCAIKINPTTTLDTVKNISLAVEKMQKDFEFRKEKSLNAYQHAMRSTWNHRINHFVSKYY